MTYIFLLIAAVAGLIALTARVINEDERGVVFRFGRALGAKGPGLVVILPGIDRVERVSLRTVTFDIVGTGLVTRDNASVDVAVAAYARVADPVKALLSVESHFLVTAQAVEAALREAVGAVTIETLLHDQPAVCNAIKARAEQRTSGWGIELEGIDVKDVVLPQSVRRALTGATPAPEAAWGAPVPEAEQSVPAPQERAAYDEPSVE